MLQEKLGWFHITFVSHHFCIQGQAGILETHSSHQAFLYSPPPPSQIRMGIFLLSSTSLSGPPAEPKRGRELISQQFFRPFLPVYFEHGGTGILFYIKDRCAPGRSGNPHAWVGGFLCFCRGWAFFKVDFPLAAEGAESNSFPRAVLWWGIEPPPQAFPSTPAPPPAPQTRPSPSA